MTKLANISKTLLNVQYFAIESFVVSLESAANFFLPKLQGFGNFVWSLEMTLTWELFCLLFFFGAV